MRGGIFSGEVYYPGRITQSGDPVWAPRNAGLEEVEVWFARIRGLAWASGDPTWAELSADARRRLQPVGFTTKRRGGAGYEQFAFERDGGKGRKREEVER